MFTWKTMLYCILSISAGITFFSQVDLQAYSIKDSSQTIVKKKRIYSPVQTITGDTLQIDSVKKDIQIVPGSSSKYTADQDSAYYRMLRLGIPAGTLAQLHSKIIAFGLKQRLAEAKENPFEILLRNMDLPAEYYLPRGSEIVQRQEMIARSQQIPTGRPSTIGAGVQIPLSSIGSFLGITEDVSPIVTYAVDYSMCVKVVVYSTAAKEIAIVFQGQQVPGKYQLAWNGRDDKGRPMPAGDYVAEVRLGNDKFVRKRITVP